MDQGESQGPRRGKRGEGSRALGPTFPPVLGRWLPPGPSLYVLSPLCNVKRGFGISNLFSECELDFKVVFFVYLSRVFQLVFLLSCFVFLQLLRYT